MNCKQARGLFGAYRDDELTQAEREWLETHFGSCPACRTGYEELGRALELVGSLPRTEVAGDFAERVVLRARRATAEPDRLAGGAPRWIPITAAAALVAVIGATVVQWVGPTLVPTRPGTTLTSPAIVQPSLVTSGRPDDGGSGEVSSAGGSIAARITDIPDSLFDHAEDVEFILDPVTLKKGRALTMVRAPQEPPRAQQAVITF
jgi:hypothetical protein